MLHFACHYYRLETKSEFVVGDWVFSRTDSAGALVAYGCLILTNLAGIGLNAPRFVAAVLSGLGHVTLGLLHFFRLLHPFRFEVFGYPWSLAASRREATVATFFGIVCLAVATRLAMAKLRSPRRT